MNNEKQQPKSDHITDTGVSVEMTSEDYEKFGWHFKEEKTPLQIVCKLRTECIGYDGYYLTEENAIEAMKKYASQVEKKRKAQVGFYKNCIKQLESNATLKAQSLIADKNKEIAELKNLLGSVINESLTLKNWEQLEEKIDNALKEKP